MTAPSWKTLLGRRLPLLGHRNWIGVVDAAYPWQTAPGVEIIATGTGHLTVLKTVLEAVRSAPHVRPRVCVDAELSALSETANPGVGPLRKKLDRLLQGEDTASLPHDEIIKRLDAAAQLFRVLLFKTEMTVPYTSVFLELDCGYWSEASEKQLRASLSPKA
jgi:hypothetical protein